ncbi:MAG: SGNH/GDSL hydrolase family protein [Chitinophagales bacterium]|nr:SGNH/GDSL hydrolase family protein [Chitinophagales bacterium]
MKKLKLILATAVVSLSLLALTLFVAEWGVGKYVFVPGSAYSNIRNFITKPYGTAEYLPQPYVNYINNPALKNPDGRYNNNAGLRLTYEVNLQKPDSIYRILFLGGSTTYGCLVHDSDTYQQRLAAILNTQLPASGTPFKKVECLNGGMGAATSAEILTHYLLKYQYMQPDLVLVNAGINDCGAYGNFSGAVYQPDYRHWRRPLQPFKEPSPFVKNLMRYNLVALLVIKLQYSFYFTMTITDNEFQYFNNQNPWFTFGADSMFTTRYNAFYNNLKTVGLTAHSLRQKMLLVTEVIDTLTMPKDFVTLYHTSLLQNNRLLDSLAHNLPCAFLKLDNTEFTSKEFVNDDLDGIHLNPHGERLKAERMAPAIMEIIKGKYPAYTYN